MFVTHLGRSALALTITLLCACSAIGAGSLPQAAPAPQVRNTAPQSKVAPRIPAGRHLYVADSGQIFVYDLAGKPGGSPIAAFSDGTDEPSGIVAGPAALYVPNAYANNVTLFKPGSPTPYAIMGGASLLAPNAVTITPNGDVYIANFGDQANSVQGWLTFYPRNRLRSTAELRSCDSGFFLTGVASDARGDVFQAGSDGLGGVDFEEFKAGSPACEVLNLAFPGVNTTGGILIDPKTQDLLVADPLSSAIDVFAPPYGNRYGHSEIPKFVIGAPGDRQPQYLALDSKAKRLYIADYIPCNANGGGCFAGAVVDVLAYPSGRLIGTYSLGLYAPSGVTIVSQ